MSIDRIIKSLSAYKHLNKLKKELDYIEGDPFFEEDIMSLQEKVCLLEQRLDSSMKVYFPIDDFELLKSLLLKYNIDTEHIQFSKSCVRIPLNSSCVAEILLLFGSNYKENSELIFTEDLLEKRCEFNDNGPVKNIHSHIFINGFYRGKYVLDYSKSSQHGRNVWQLIVSHDGKWQRYDKMYIIDSLQSGDDTAFHLETQIASYKHLGNDFCVRKKVMTRAQWDYEISNIIKKSGGRCVPIIHLEIHGDDNGNLIIGGDTTTVPMSEFLESMKKVSRKCKAKILLSLAVCNGIKYFKNNKDFSDLPFQCVIGADTKISSSNLEARFGSFYKELLQDSTAKIDVSKAYEKMQKEYISDERNKVWYPDETFIMLSDKTKNYS